MEDSEKGEDIVPKVTKAYTDGVFLIPSLFLGTDPKDRSNQKCKKKSSFEVNRSQWTTKNELIVHRTTENQE